MDELKNEKENSVATYAKELESNEKLTDYKIIRKAIYDLCPKNDLEYFDHNYRYINFILEPIYQEEFEKALKRFYSEIINFEEPQKVALMRAATRLLKYALKDFNEVNVKINQNKELFKINEEISPLGKALEEYIVELLCQKLHDIPYEPKKAERDIVSGGLYDMNQDLKRYIYNHFYDDPRDPDKVMILPPEYPIITETLLESRDKYKE